MAVPRSKNPLPQRRSWRFYGLYGLYLLVATGIAFCAFETALSLAGVLPADAYEDPYVGFSRAYPLFEPSEPGSPTMQTAENKLRFFNYQTFPLKKAPDTVRIFCLGGSTTFGRPYADNTSYVAWLRAMLPEADPARRWEVINAGGISYASYRLAVLMEELIQYDPDVFIIYTGHNEFLERRTYVDTSAAGPMLSTLKHLLARTRTIAVAQRWRDTLAFSHEAPAGTVLGADVVTRLEQSIGPADYHRDEHHAEEVLRHFRFNLNRMVTLAEGSGARIILVTPASNLRDCSPFKSEHKAGLSELALNSWDATMDRATRAAEAGDFATEEAALTEALALDGAYAETWYRLGQLRERRGDAAGAARDYQRARDEDICPLRAPSSFVETVRNVASRRAVPLADVESLYAERSENGNSGSNLFLDHVHPTPEGHQMIAEALLEAMIPMLDLALPPNWSTHVAPEIARTMESLRSPDDEALALRNLAQVLSWAGKFDEASPLIEMCVEQRPDDADAQALQGWIAEQRSLAGPAIASYRKALALDPDHLLAIRQLIPLLIDTGDIADASERYSEAIRRRPADPVIRGFGDRLPAVQP